MRGVDMSGCPTMWDAIVIGSGIGGMTAGGLLAGVAGKKVLVLEKHSEPGGLTHVFRRDGASWDVGLHYVGEVEPGSLVRAFFDYLSGAELCWNRMTDEFERFVYPGLEFRVPSDPRRYEDRLIERFPDEGRAIRRYFRDVRAVRRWATLGFTHGFVPWPVQPLLRTIQRLTQGRAVQTTKQYLDKHFRSPLLRALLASQWGDYGLPPARSAFAIHAQIVSHYLRGAWFPQGGSGRIARTFERGIERYGGSIRVCQEVTSILVRDARAVGVEVLDRRGTEPRQATHLAPIVISNVGAPVTFGQMLPADGEVGAKTAGLRMLMQNLRGALSAVTLYLRLKAPVSTIGVKGENYWINATIDHDAVENERSARLLEGDPLEVYVSFPSAKSGDDQFHTAEIISFVDPRAFTAWRDRPKGNRGADYSALKQRIGEGLLRVAETAIPGLTTLIGYAELSTPLTVDYYTSHPLGFFYGLSATPERYKSELLGPRTPIDGLYLAGSDAGCLGIAGALMGGVGAACQALGPTGFPRIVVALKKGPDRRRPLTLPPEKTRAVLVAKRQLTPTIWQTDFELEVPVEAFTAGQFARLRVGDFEWRDYSIAGLDGAKLRLLISTRTGGHGSQFVIGAEPSTKTEIELPLGHYTMARNPHRKVFIATGTGLAPFLPMFRQLEREGALGGSELYFGCRTVAEDITLHFDPMPAMVVRCVSREEPPLGGFKGRVSRAILGVDFDAARTDFYVCGSAAMVADCREVLEQRGASRIHIETY
jgi:phytoene dehydrogenase-like protein/ferredoxin-NADP reductase